MKQQRKPLDAKDATKVAEIRELQNGQERKIVSSSQHMASAKRDHEKALAALDALHSEYSKLVDRLGRKYGIDGPAFTTSDGLVTSV
jgi:hypothetical protein